MYTMKKSTLYLFLFVSVALFSCKKSFLTLLPPSETTDANFFKTTADINNAVIAAYTPLQTLYLGNYPSLSPFFVTMMEARSDNVQDLNPGANAGTEYNIDRFLAGSDNTGCRRRWDSIYHAIYRCNLALSHINVVTDSTLKAQYQGELLFLRALHYFNIVRLWGGAPLILTPITASQTLKVGRGSVQQVYTAIEGDLVQAAGLLPAVYSSTANLGRATQGAALALLGKVYLTEAKYSQAVSTLQGLAAAGNPYGYSLLPSIASVFSVTNKMNAEVIFAVRYNKSVAGEGHALPSYLNQPGLDPKLIGAYGPTDTRAALLTTVTLDANDKPVQKYYDTYDPNTKTLGNDFIVLRYADVLLMYSEALNEVGYDGDVNGPAFANLNAVRSRAGATLFTAAALPDQGSFRQAVWQERRLELPLELHRWFDLCRTNTAAAAFAASGLTPVNFQPFNYLYPIPESEIQTMNNASLFPQNPGY